MTNRCKFRAHVARTLFVTAWADWMDQYGPGAPGNGCDLMEVAPKTCKSAYRKADELIEKLEKAWRQPLSVIIERARKVYKPNRRGDLVDELAFCLTMQALGHGIAWIDDQEPFDGHHPGVSIDYTYFDLPRQYKIPSDPKCSWFTVVAVYAGNHQRFVDSYFVESPAEAENAAQTNAVICGKELIVAAVFKGKKKPVDAQ